VLLLAIDITCLTKLYRSLPGHSEFISLGAMGMTGQTAYMGVFEEMKLEKDHVLVVSGAAG
jgi:NADPH-dependent curcumin reductase CurA